MVFVAFFAPPVFADIRDNLVDFFNSHDNPWGDRIENPIRECQDELMHESAVLHELLNLVSDDTHTSRDVHALLARAKTQANPARQSSGLLHAIMLGNVNATIVDAAPPRRRQCNYQS